METNQYPVTYLVADQTKLNNLTYVAQLIDDGVDPDAHEVAKLLAALHARSLSGGDHSEITTKIFETLRKNVSGDPTNAVWFSNGEAVVYDHKQLGYVVLSQNDWAAWFEAKRDGGLQ